MATISWASGVSGNWTTASDWTGGIVPAGRNSASIKVAPVSSNYTVSVTTPVTVGALTLDQKSATLLVSGSVASSDLALQAGALLLDGGTLAGTVVASSGKFELGDGNNSSANGTLNNVTWRGPQNETETSTSGNNSTLTIITGLTLTPASGTGTGTASFVDRVVLDAVSSLSSASITAYSGIYVTAVSTLTLASTLSLSTACIIGTSVTSLVNVGTLTLSSVAGGNGSILPSLAGFNNILNSGIMTFNSSYETLSTASFVNNGQIIVLGGNGFDDETVFSASSITNNGTITIAAGNELLIANAVALQTAGAHSSIVLGGTLQLGGTLTTAQLLAFEAGDHITTTGTAGILGTTGLLNNAGATLTVGAAAIVGDLTLSAGEISGGTIITQDGGGAAGLGPREVVSSSGVSAGLLLNNLTLQSDTPTLTINGLNFNDVKVTGASTLAMDSIGSFTGGSLTTVATLVAGGMLSLNDVSLSSDLTILSGSSNAGGGAITLGNMQSTAGVTMQLYSSELFLDPGETVSSAQINFYGSGTNDTLSSSGSSSLAATIAASSMVSVAAGNPLYINDIGIYGSGGGATTQIDLLGSLLDSGSVFAGDFVNAGTIAGTGSFQLLGLPVTNSGVIDMVGGSFLQTASAFANGAGATALTNTGTIEVTSGGTLGINLASLTNTGSISVTDGTLLLDGTLTLASLTEIAAPGSQIGVLGSLNLGGGTVTPGVSGVPDFFLAKDGLLTNGTLLVQSGQDLTIDGSNEGTTSTGAPQIPDLVNNGTVTADYSSVLGTISGSGTVNISGTGTLIFNDNWIALTVAGPVSAGTINFASPDQALVLQDSASGAFAGTLSSFAVGDSIVLAGETIKKASFVGHSIVATLSTGGSIVLQTTSALTGTLTISKDPSDIGTDDIKYTSAAAVSLPDWSGSALVTSAEPALNTHAAGSLGATRLAIENIWDGALHHALGLK